MRSMALWRAVWMIQARGNSGTPETRHWSTAAVKASWAASSATSKSRTSRIRVATIRPQSERYTASTAAFASTGILHVREVLVGVSIPASAIRPIDGGTRREIHAPDLSRRAGVGQARRDRPTADLRGDRQ